MSTVEEKKLIAEADFLRSLLAEFDAGLSGWDPGVTAHWKGKRGHGYWGESLSFSHVEWEFLKPLLIELRLLRKLQKKSKK